MKEYIQNYSIFTSKARNAFTLIELLVVIAIIGILSSVVLASLSGARESAQITRVASDLNQIETGMTMWMQSTSKTQWPTNSELGLGVNPPIEDIATSTELGNYLNSVPNPVIGITKYRYDNNGDTFNCETGDPIYYGVTIYVTGLSQDIGEKLDGIIDGGNSADLSCGKLTWRDSANGGQIRYFLSANQSF